MWPTITQGGRGAGTKLHANGRLDGCFMQPKQSQRRQWKHIRRVGKLSRQSLEDLLLFLYNHLHLLEGKHSINILCSPLPSSGATEAHSLAEGTLRR